MNARAIWALLKFGGSKLSQWDNLYEYNKSPLRYFSYLLPLLGFYVVADSEVRAFLILNPPLADIVGIKGSSVSLKFKMLYFGAWFLTIASILVYWFCPPILRMFGSVREWYLAEAHMMTERRLDDLLKKICYLEVSQKYRLDAMYFESLWSRISSWREYGHPPFEKLVRIDESNIKVMAAIKAHIVDTMSKLRGLSREHSVAEIMSMFLVPQKQYHQVARRISAVLFATGALFIGTASLWSFVDVVCVLMGL